MDESHCLAVSGFRTACVKAGIKKKSTAKGDMGLIVADGPACAAGVFTKSMAAAAPVRVCREHLKTGSAIRAILVNSGNANACTGAEGEANCRTLGRELAGLLKIDAEAILHASTGVIGHQLPMDPMRSALPGLVKGLDTGNGFGLAQTIMTTDLVPKWTCVQGTIGGKPVTVSGIAKGSGMIAPNMATMISFVLTDAAIAPDTLQDLWSEVTAATFNRVTVDTDTSTNDTGIILASGAAGNPVITDKTAEERGHFRALLFTAVNPLAKAIAADGEGATKLIKVTAAGFGGNAACDRVARTIAESPLVKTAMFGNDPNWGRIIAAAGRSGITFDTAAVDIDLCAVTVFRKGTPLDFDRAGLAEKLKAKETYIDITCAAGGGAGHIYTCDYSYDYIKINAEYHT